MLNNFAKFLLVSTSLAPVLGAIAVSQFVRGDPWTHWLGWSIAALLLIALCWMMLRYAGRNAQTQLIHLNTIERNDKEVVAFLLAYFLPFISSDNAPFFHHWLTSTYILIIIFLSIIHAGMLHFNPVMGLIGYHFYQIKNQNDLTQLLISRHELTRPGMDVRTVRLAHDIYLHIGEDHA